MQILMSPKKKPQEKAGSTSGEKLMDQDPGLDPGSRGRSFSFYRWKSICREEMLVRTRDTAFILPTIRHHPWSRGAGSGLSA